MKRILACLYWPPCVLFTDLASSEKANQAVCSKNWDRYLISFLFEAVLNCLVSGASCLIQVILELNFVCFSAFRTEHRRSEWYQFYPCFRELRQSLLLVLHSWKSDLELCLFWILCDVCSLRQKGHQAIANRCPFLWSLWSVDLLLATDCLLLPWLPRSCWSWTFRWLLYQSSVSCRCSNWCHFSIYCLVL